MTDVRAGARLKSSVSEAEVIVTKTPTEEVEIRCGGAPMQAPDAPAGLEAERTLDLGEALLLGKRYVDDPTGLEVLCTKPGSGTLTCNGRTMQVKEPKPLPSSD
jgi:hypothetical protein